jgi:hypothetical protein
MRTPMPGATATAAQPTDPNQSKLSKLQELMEQRILLLDGA